MTDKSIKRLSFEITEESNNILFYVLPLLTDIEHINININCEIIDVTDKNWVTAYIAQNSSIRYSIKHLSESSDIKEQFIHNLASIGATNPISEMSPELKYDIKFDYYHMKPGDSLVFSIHSSKVRVGVKTTIIEYPLN